MKVCHACGHRFTEGSKALQVQTSGPTSGSDVDVGFGDAFASWALVAVPHPRDLDPQGNVTGACEMLCTEVGDQSVTIASRDTRTSKWSADLLAGEVALFSFWGSRLALRKETVALTAFGGFLAFDKASKTVSLVGIPGDSGRAPYLSISPDVVGLTSSSGKSSLALRDGAATISGATVALDAGSVNVGKNADDPVVTKSYLAAMLNVLLTIFDAHTHASFSAPPVPLASPAVLPMPLGALTVKASR
jgi:hypothetical protein